MFFRKLLSGFVVDELIALPDTHVDGAATGTARDVVRDVADCGAVV